MTSVTGTATTDRTRFLRVALGLDAIVTGGNGLAYLALAGPIGDFLGAPAGPLRVIGVFLLAYGAAVGLIGTRRDISRTAVWAVIALNLLWVVDSIALVIAGWFPLTTIGTVWVIAQALAVLAFAELQYIGLRRAR